MPVYAPYSGVQLKPRELILSLRCSLQHGQNYMHLLPTEIPCTTRNPIYPLLLPSPFFFYFLSKQLCPIYKVSFAFHMSYTKPASFKERIHSKKYSWLLHSAGHFLWDRSAPSQRRWSLVYFYKSCYRTRTFGHLLG